MSKNAEVSMSLRVDFTMIQTVYRELSLAVPNKAKNVAGLVLQRLDAMQDSGEVRKPVAAMQASQT